MGDQAVHAVLLRVEHDRLQVREAGDDSLFLSRKNFSEFGWRRNPLVNLFIGIVLLLLLLYRAALDGLFLLLDDVETALDQLVLKHGDPIIETEINAGVHLEDHAEHLLADLLVLAVEGDLPQHSDSFHLVGRHHSAHLDHLLVKLFVGQRRLLVSLAGSSDGCLRAVIILNDKLVGSLIDKDEETLDAVVALHIKVDKVV